MIYVVIETGHAMDREYTILCCASFDEGKATREAERLQKEYEDEADWLAKSQQRHFLVSQVKLI